MESSAPSINLHRCICLSLFLSYTLSLSLSDSNALVSLCTSHGRYMNRKFSLKIGTVLCGFLLVVAVVVVVWIGSHNLYHLLINNCLHTKYVWFNVMAWVLSVDDVINVRSCGRLHESMFVLFYYCMHKSSRLNILRKQITKCTHTTSKSSSSRHSHSKAYSLYSQWRYIWF